MIQSFRQEILSIVYTCYRENEQNNPVKRMKKRSKQQLQAFSVYFAGMTSSQ